MKKLKRSITVLVCLILLSTNIQGQYNSVAKVVANKKFTDFRNKWIFEFDNTILRVTSQNSSTTERFRLSSITNGEIKYKSTSSNGIASVYAKTNVNNYGQVTYFDDVSINVNSDKISHNGLVKKYSGKSNNNYSRKKNTNYIKPKAIKQGLHKEYYKNRQLKSKGNYKDGRINGLYQEYHYNGKLKLKGNYKHDTSNGLFQRYYSNGQLESKGNYKNAEKYGIHQYYYENGLLKEKETYKYNKYGNTYVSSSEKYYENGQLVHKVIYNYKTVEARNESDKNFTRSDNRKILYLDNNPYDGITIDKYSDGGYDVNTYKNGLGQGLWERYDGNGQLEVKKLLVDGSQITTEFQPLSYKNNLYIFSSLYNTKTKTEDLKLWSGSAYSKHENGKRKAEYFFLDGKKDGWQRHYYKNGNKKRETLYKKGKKIKDRKYKQVGSVVSIEANAQREKNRLEAMNYADVSQKNQAIEIALNPKKAFNYGTDNNYIIDSNTSKIYGFSLGTVFYHKIPNAALFAEINNKNGSYINETDDGVVTELEIFAPTYYAGTATFFKKTKKEREQYYKAMQTYIENANKITTKNLPIVGEKTEGGQFTHKAYINKAKVWGNQGSVTTWYFEDDNKYVIKDNFNYVSPKGVRFGAGVRYKGDKDEVTFEMLEGRRSYLNKLCEQIIATARLELGKKGLN
jgi:antitoxin component YwqK of YwqJK toxin-antitoxin module